MEAIDSFRNVGTYRTARRYIPEFYIFLTMHLKIILVGNQLDAQFLL